MHVTPIQNKIQNYSLKNTRNITSNNMNFQHRAQIQPKTLGLPMATLCTVFMNKMQNNTSKENLEFGIINEGIIKSKKNNSAELHQQKLDILNSVFSKEELKNHKNVQEAMYLLLRDGGEAQIPYTKSMVDLIVSDEKLYKNENILKNFSDITYTTLWDFDDRKAILEKYLENPELAKIETLNNSIGDITAQTNTWYQKNIIMKVLETPELYENDNIIKNASNSFFGVTVYASQEDVDAKLAMLDAFIGSEYLQEHDILNKNFGEIVSNTTADNAFVFDVAREKNLLNSDNFTQHLPQFLTFANNDNTLRTVNLMLENSSLWEKDFPMINMLKTIHNKSQADVIRIILSHEDLQTQPVLDNITVINRSVKDANSKTIALDLLSNKDILNNKNILEGFAPLVNKASKNEDAKNVVYKFLISKDIDGLSNLAGLIKGLIS